MPEFFTYFADRRSPHEVRFELERRSGTLFPRTQDRPLTYVAEREWMTFRSRMELRFQGCVPNTLLYSLQVITRAAAHTRDEAGLEEDSERAFRHWMTGFESISSDNMPDLLSADVTTQVAAETVRWEAEAAARRSAIDADLEAIRAAQQQVLALIRAGKRYAIGHKEGTTSIELVGGVLVKSNRGEWNDSESYADEPAMLRFLRSYFDYEATKDTAPHQPPELEIWKNIGSQFR